MKKNQKNEISVLNIFHKKSSYYKITASNFMLHNIQQLSKSVLRNCKFHLLIQ